MRRTLTKLYEEITRFPKFSLICGLFFCFYLCFHLPELKTLVSLSDIQDSTLLKAKQYRDFKNIFEAGDSVFLTLKPKDQSISKAEFLHFDKELLEIYNDNEGIKSIHPLFEFRIPQYKGNKLIFKQLVTKDTLELKSLKDSPWERIFTSKDHKDISYELVIEPKVFGSFGTHNQKSILELMKRLEKVQMKMPRTEIKISGPPIFSFYALKGVIVNNLLNIVFLFLLIFGFKYFFGTWKSGILASSCFFLTGFSLYGFMALTNTPLEILSSALFLLITLTSIEDFIYLYCAHQKDGSLDNCFKKLITPSFLTSLTTVIGFGTLLFSEVDLIKRLGLWAAIGAIMQWLICFLLLPAFLKTFNINTLVIKKNHSLPKLFNFNLSTKVRYILYLSYPLAILGLFNMPLNDSPINLFENNHIINQDLNYLQESKGWKSKINLLFSDEAQEVHVKEISQKIAKLKNVSIILDPFHYLDNYTLNFSKATQNMIRDGYFNSTAAERFMTDERQFQADIYIKNLNFQDVNLMKNEIENICQQYCYPIGEMITYAEFTQNVPLTLIQSFLLSLLGVSIILFILLKKNNEPNPILYILNSLWGPTVVLLLFWVFELELNFMSSTFATILVGLAGDNAIQFIYRNKDENLLEGINEKSAPALLTLLFTLICCLLFLFSYFKPPQTFGLIIAFGMICSAFGDIIFNKDYLKTYFKNTPDI